LPCDRASDERRRRDRSAPGDRRWTEPRSRHLRGRLERGRITRWRGGRSIGSGWSRRRRETLWRGVVTAHRLAHRALPHGGLIGGAGRGWRRAALLRERRELRPALRTTRGRHLRPRRQRDRRFATTASWSAIRGRRRRCWRVSTTTSWSAIRSGGWRRVTAAHPWGAGWWCSPAATASRHASTAHVACRVGVLEHPTAARAGPHPALLSAGSPGGLPEREG